MCTHTSDLSQRGAGLAAPSGPDPHRHDGDVVGRAPLHRLARQPVAGRFVADVDSGLPLSALDLLILPAGKGR